jgi:DNA repair protein RecO (recombination protein O)
MKVQTEGLVLRQIQTVNGRRMITILTKGFGKIHAGTSLTERGRSKSALLLRPFTHGRYELFSNHQNYHLQQGETLQNFYKLGENIDKYMYGAYALEFADRFLEEEQPAEEFFYLVLDYLKALEKREKQYQTLLLGFQWKVLKLSGQQPHLKSCVQCGETNHLIYFGIPEGGILCRQCYENHSRESNDSLIYPINKGIINAIQYFFDTPILGLEKVALTSEMAFSLKTLVDPYMKYHLDIKDLNSERFFMES